MSNWEPAGLPADDLKNLVTRFGMPGLAAQAFLRRGIIRAEDVRFFMDRNLQSAHVPFLFQDMENVVERIGQAVEEKEKILVFGDRDVDGMTSSAIMVRYLEDQGAEVSWQLPMEDESYGLTMAVVDKAVADGITLIITVDCGITSLDEVDHAQEEGIDVIIIDHHNPLDEIPAAVGIIDPKVEDAGYPFQGLCAAALAAKVTFAMDLARSPWFGQESCLLNIRPGNGDALIFEAVRMKNLVETGRLTESLVETSNPAVFNRILPFIQGLPLLVWEKDQQLKYMKKLFGQGSDIYLEGLEDRVGRSFPDLRGRSLFRMLGGSRLARFSTVMPGEIDVLKHLFLVMCLAEAKEAVARHEQALGLAAIGIVADMSPLLDENRILLAKGLEILPRLNNPGLVALMRELQILQEPMVLKDVGWKLSPVLNASGRMGRPDIALSLLLSKDPSQINSLVKELVRLNDSRKKEGEQALGRSRKSARESLERNDGKLIFLRDDQAVRGITGIIAAQLAREYRVPAIMVTKVHDRCVGSIRTVRGVNATALLSSVSDLLGDWGGHDAAGGFSVDPESFTALEDRMQSLARSLELEDDAGMLAMPDVVVPPEAMKEDLWKVEETFQPYGQESPQLLYLARNLLVQEIQLVGKEKTHVRMSLKSLDRIWPAIFWNAVERVPGDFKAQDHVDVMFRLERNTWGATSNLQLQVVDVRRTTGGS